MILGQRPTSPRGEQATLPWAPLAYCGSHCCANCITTGSGRDLPSVARNSVSRGRVPALHNATATAQPGNTGVRHPRYGTPRDVTLPLPRPTGCTSCPTNCRETSCPVILILSGTRHLATLIGGLGRERRFQGPPHGHTRSSISNETT